MADNDKTSVNSVPQVNYPNEAKPLPKLENFTDFESLEVIGKGGYGVCCKGKRRLTEEVCAVKIFHFDTSEMDINTAESFAKDAEDRFRDEIKTLHQLRQKHLFHPHIVHLGDAGVHPSLHYWMEFVAGPQGDNLEHWKEYIEKEFWDDYTTNESDKPLTLHELLGANRLEPADAYRLALQMAGALQYLHSQGIIHRDIKPKNILIDKENNVKITDFGFAKQLQQGIGRSTGTQTGIGLSSEGYTAPEVREDLKSADARSDIWSLGTVICRMVSGQKTYSGRAFRKANLSKAWDELIEDMLAEDPNERIETMAEVVECLTGLVKPSAGVSQPPASQASGGKAGELLEFTLKGMQWRFRWCPSGEFLMGSPSGEKDRDDDETQHRVRLTRGFWMGETAVTQEQWEAVMGSNPSNFKGRKNPVEQVSWNDCQEFVQKFNEKLNEAGTLAPASLNGFVASLPTEAQWEYACRAGSTTAYCFGDDVNSLAQYAWYSSNANETHEVGTKKPNAWGLYDMHGNVWEWCQDWDCGYGGDALDPVGASFGSYRVYRGGSWSIRANSCRSANRLSITPVYRRNYLGLRLSLVSDGR